MFRLSNEQNIKLNQWYSDLFKDGEPYTGAIGGSLTYSFTPTSLGVIVKVKEAITDQEIDLTDYDMW